MYTIDGMDKMAIQATANEHMEMLFKFTLALFPGDIAFCRRIFLDILNSLKLINTNGGNITTIKVTRWAVVEIIESFEEIALKAM